MMDTLLNPRIPVQVEKIHFIRPHRRALLGVLKLKHRPCRSGCMLAGISNGVERAYTIAQPLDIMANSVGGIFGKGR